MLELWTYQENSATIGGNQFCYAEWHQRRVSKKRNTGWRRNKQLIPDRTSAGTAVDPSSLKKAYRGASIRRKSAANKIPKMCAKT